MLLWCYLVPVPPASRCLVGKVGYFFGIPATGTRDSDPYKKWWKTSVQPGRNASVTQISEIDDVDHFDIYLSEARQLCLSFCVSLLLLLTY